MYLDARVESGRSARGPRATRPSSLNRIAYFRLQLVRHPNRIHRSTVGVLLQHGGAHERAREIVGDEPADDASLQDVLANARHPLRRGCEIRRDDVPRFYSVLHDLEVTDVGSKQGLHSTAVDAVHDDDFIGGLAQRREEFGLEQVAVSGDESNEHAIRAAELRNALIEVRPHVLMLTRQLLGE